MVAKSRNSVNTGLIEAAVAALAERDGSTVKSIFNYLLKTKKVRPSSRTKVVLAIRRALKSGVLTKKSANTFVLRASEQPSRASLAKNRKRKTRRTRKKSVKKTIKRRRRQRKRKSLKKKSSKKSKRAARKSQKKRRPKVNRKRKTQVKVVQATVQRKRYSRYPLRKAARGIRYTA